MSRRQRALRKGRLAEDLCTLWLCLKGYRILARRFRVPVGEIDIVARRGRTLVFIEVKARRRLTDALYAVTPRQRRRLARAAEAWCQTRPGSSESPQRFDVMLVLPFRPPKHIMDAWRP